MELLIAAGVAWLGYNLSSKPRPQAAQTLQPQPQTLQPQTLQPQTLPQTQSQNPQQKDAPGKEFREASYPFPPANVLPSVREELERVAEKAWRAAEDPKSTGVINPATLPYFRSARAQNTSDAIKDRKHDLFTGSMLFDKSTTGTYRNKSEAPARFQPMPQPVSSSGSAGNPVCWERQLPVPSLLQNNVLPTEQQRVGPGVGIGPDVSATDGFHPMLRVMPKNVGDYKKNPLNVRINAGSSANAMRTADPVVAVNRAPRVWDMNRRPPEPTMAAVTARTQRPDVLGLKWVDDRIIGDEKYFGNPALGSHPVPADPRWDTRGRGDVNPGLPQTNVTGARYGTGGFATASFDTQRMTSQQREQQGFVGTLTGDHVRAMAPSGHILPPTMRDLATGRDPRYLGGAGHYVPSGATQLSDRTKTTLRQLTAGPADNGPAAPVLKGPTVQCTYKQLEKPAKRDSIMGYVPGVQRTNEFRRANLGDDDPWAVAGICRGKAVALRQRATENRVMAHAASGSMYVNMAPAGTSTVLSNRLPEVNRRQDFGLAQTVLAKNELHVPIA